MTGVVTICWFGYCKLLTVYYVDAAMIVLSFLKFDC